MSIDLAAQLIRNAIMLGLTVAAPLLLTSLVVGVAVSLVQAVTQIQEQTLTFIPKLLVVAFVFIVTLPWIISKLVEYLVGSIRTMGGMVG